MTKDPRLGVVKRRTKLEVRGAREALQQSTAEFNGALRLPFVADRYNAISPERHRSSVGIFEVLGKL